MDQWVLFVNYRIDEKTQKLCKKSQQIRQNQISHTGGAKSLDRRRAEMMAKGIDIDRGKMWTETHKRKDGSYVTEAARDIGEKIEEIRSQSQKVLSKFHPRMHFGIVLCPEHPGRVRGLGLSVVPTMAFKQASRRFKHVDVSSSNTSTPTPEWQQKATSMKSQLNALLSLYQRNIGNIPEEFSHLFPPPPQELNIESGAHQSPMEPRTD